MLFYNTSMLFYTYHKATGEMDIVRYEKKNCLIIMKPFANLQVNCLWVFLMNFKGKPHIGEN